MTTERLHPWGSRLVLLCQVSGSVSKLVTKEPRCRRRRRINVGIMRFLFACSALFQAFVTNLDTIGRLVGEDGGPLGSFSSAGPPVLDPCQASSPDVSRGHSHESPSSAACSSRPTVRSGAGLQPPAGNHHPVASLVHGWAVPLRRTALRGGTRRHPTPRSVLRAGSSRLIECSVLRATSPQKQVPADNRDTRKAQDQ